MLSIATKIDEIGSAPKVLMSMLDFIIDSTAHVHIRLKNMFKVEYLNEMILKRH